VLKPYKIEQYQAEFSPKWACEMPEGCPPEDIMVPYEHPFFRLSKKATSYDADDFATYAEKDPNRNWGEQLPLAVGLSLIDNENKARKNLKLPLFKHFKGIIALSLNPKEGVVKQTGIHTSHYTWWRTKAFDLSDLKMLEL
jgi:hypothetical protein